MWKSEGKTYKTTKEWYMIQVIWYSIWCVFPGRYITDLSLHRKPLQDFVFWCHLGVILSETSVDQFVGFVLVLVFPQQGFFSLKINNKNVKKCTTSVRYLSLCTWWSSKDWSSQKYTEPIWRLWSVSILLLISFSELSVSPAANPSPSMTLWALGFTAQTVINGWWAVTPGCQIQLCSRAVYFPLP